MKLSLKTRRKDYNTLILSFPSVLRAAMLIISVLLAISVFLAPDETGSSSSDVVPVILSALSFSFASHNEKWVFDRNGKVVSIRTSFLLITRKQQFNMTDIAEISVEKVAKGRMPDSSCVKVSVCMKNSAPKEIEIFPSLNFSNAIRKAETISDFCSVPLKKESNQPDNSALTPV